MADGFPTSTHSTDRTGEAPTYVSVIDQQVRHASHPGPQPTLPQPPDSLLAIFSAPMPSAEVDEALIRHHVDEPDRQPLPPVTFHLRQGSAMQLITAQVPAELTSTLTDTQHNRLVALLAAQPPARSEPKVTPFGTTHAQLSFSVDDPQPGPAGSRGRIPLTIHVGLGGDDAGNASVSAIGIGQGNALVLPVRERCSFSTPEETVNVLLPRRQYTAQQEEALREPGCAHFTSVNDIGLLQYSCLRFGTGEGAKLLDVNVQLRLEPVLDLWVVSGISAKARPMPLRLHDDCAAWLARPRDDAQPPAHDEDEGCGPGLSSEAMESIRACLDAHEHHTPLPAGATVTRNTFGMRVALEVQERQDPAPQKLNVCINFVPDGQRYVVAQVSVIRPSSQTGQEDISHYDRSSTETWQNPLGRTRRTSTYSSLSSNDSRRSSNVRERDRSPARDDSRHKRTRTNESMAPSASELRQGQAWLEKAIRDEVSEMDLGDTEPSTSEVTSATASTSTAPAPPASAIFITQADYRAREGLASTVPVCGPIAAGAALGVAVPFGEMLNVNPNAHQEGNDDAEMTKLLTDFGGVSVSAATFVEAEGGHAAVVAGLARHLEEHDHDAAVLLYSYGTLSAHTPGTAGAHHVAVFQVGGQWMLHDGRSEDGEPVALTLDRIVRGIFGQNTQGVGQLEVLSFVRPDEAFTLEVGPGRLKLGSDVNANSNTSWVATLRLAGVRFALMERDGPKVDFNQHGQDLVNAANAHPSRFVGSRSIVCNRVALPPSWDLAAFEMQGWGCNLTLRTSPQDRSVVTAITVKAVRPLPTSVSGSQALTLKTPLPNGWNSALTKSISRFAPEFEGVRRGKECDWTATAKLVVQACSAAPDAWRLGIDTQGREIREYRNVTLLDAQYNVYVRLSDPATLEVYDFRLCHTSRVEEPDFKWFKKREAS